MGLFSAVKSVAKKISETAKKAADYVEDKVSDAGTAVGNKIEEAGGWIGDKIGSNRIGDAVKHVFAVAGSGVKGIFDTVGAVIGGSIKMAALFVTADFGLFLEGARDIISTAIGTGLLVVGHTIGFLGTIITIQDSNLRKLNEKEKIALIRVFKDSIDYDVIQVHEGAYGFFGFSFSGLNDRPLGLGNVMYLKRERITDELLVHECTHVWQYQNIGNRYTADAIGAQLFVHETYNWEREINVRNKTKWLQLNREAQAEFLEDLWTNGRREDNAGVVISSSNGAFYDADSVTTFGTLEMTHTDPEDVVTVRNYTDFARGAVATVRAG